MATEVSVRGTAVLERAMLAPMQRPLASSADRDRVELGGVYVDQVGLAEAAARIREFVRSGLSHQIVTVNLDFLSIARRNPEFRKTINSAHLAVADGMPLVWLSRLKRAALAERVAGVDLVAESCRIAAEDGASVFLLGAAPGVAAAAARRMESEYPGLRIAGTYSPPLGPLTRRENARIVRMIRRASPDFLFVALGAPRQDLWIQEFQPQLEVPVAMGVGCVFDVMAGSVKRAPGWMQRTGLEWAPPGCSPDWLRCRCSAGVPKTKRRIIATFRPPYVTKRMTAPGVRTTDECRATSN
jgi:N-acetylglucosaminyldiphosphoundecaprenol N-acetyl-beta-D-mannosaminyltransferase